MKRNEPTGNKPDSERPEDKPREKPFTELYPRWDAPTFDPTKSYLKPKSMNETSNRSVMSRLYESVLDSFSDARKKMLREEVERNEPKPTTQVWGTNG